MIYWNEGPKHNSCTVFVRLRSHWKWLITTKSYTQHIHCKLEEREREEKTPIEKSLYRFRFVDDWQSRLFRSLSLPIQWFISWIILCVPTNVKYFKISYNSPNTSIHSLTEKHLSTSCKHINSIHTNEMPRRRPGDGNEGERNFGDDII